MHSDTSNVNTAQLDFARVDSCPNAEAEHGEGVTQGEGSSDSPARPGPFQRDVAPTRVVTWSTSAVLAWLGGGEEVD
jgi:hypothetical protein